MRSHDETWRRTLDNIEKTVERLTQGVIVILDDDQIFLNRVGGLLQECGRRVLVTTNPYEFFKLLGHNFVEAAIVDLNLKDMDCLKVLSEVHQRKIKKAALCLKSKEDVDLPNGIGYISKNNGSIDVAILNFLKQENKNANADNS